MPSRTAPAAAETSPAPRARGLLGPLLGLVAVAALAVAAFAGGGNDASEPIPDATTDDALPDPAAGDAASPGPSDAAAPGPSDEQIAALRGYERRHANDPMAVGAVDAPVVMVEWSDYQCPFCGSFARDTKPVLLDRYVDEGLLRIEYRDLPILGEESNLAALAARAAARQDAFWAYHDRLFAEERPVNGGMLTREYLLGLAGDLDLDVERFAADLDDPEVAAAVRADLEEGRQLGITATPAFLINGRPLLGGQPTEVFERIVEQLAAESATDAP